MSLTFERTKKSPHFIIHYNLRNPLKGRGHGMRGIQDEVLVDIYADALERLYEVMTTPPWSRPAPLGGKGEIIVKVFNTAERGVDGAFTEVDPDGIPYIALPSGNDEPTAEGARQRAIAEAVHEATHVFNSTERPLMDEKMKPWRWMHEAMAVYMETVVLQSNNDFHRFLRPWVVLPEIPLDTEAFGYQAGMFLYYLAEKMGPEIINKIWTPLSKGSPEKPLEAIERVLRQEQGRIFSSASPDDDDVFASGYCLDSYFFQDPANACHARNVFQRHGERHTCESFWLSPGSSPTTGDCLDHLACRYYRFFLENPVTKLEVQLLTNHERGGTTLKAELAIVNKQKQCGPVHRLRPVSSSASLGRVLELFTEIPQIVPGNIDHIVLVVSNCGLRGAQRDPSIDHDDDRQYTVTVTAR